MGPFAVHTPIGHRQCIPLTCFHQSFFRKIRRKFLENLGAVLIHEEADEIGGGVELQGKGIREFGFPAGDGRL